MTPAITRRARRPRPLPTFLPELCRRLAAEGAQRIYLFGSYARGEADEDSDVDVVVIQETPLSFFDRLRKAWASADAEWPVEILVYTPAEFETMRREGNALAETVVVFIEAEPGREREVRADAYEAATQVRGGYSVTRGACAWVQGFA